MAQNINPVQTNIPQAKPQQNSNQDTPSANYVTPPPIPQTSKSPQPITTKSKPPVKPQPNLPAQNPAPAVSPSPWGNQAGGYLPGSNQAGQNTGFSGGTNNPSAGFGAGFGTGFGSQAGMGPAPYQPNKRQTPEERMKMIEKVYEEVLCRKPDTRDINYYKYSTLNEDQIRKQLLTSAEHKDMIKNGREYENLKKQTEQFKTKTRMLEGKINDQLEEFKQLNILLNEKNKLIQNLRSGNPTQRLDTPEEITDSARHAEHIPQCRIPEQAQPPPSDTTEPQVEVNPSKPIETPEMKPITESLLSDSKKQATEDTPIVAPPPPVATFTDEPDQTNSKPKNTSKFKKYLKDIF